MNEKRKAVIKELLGWLLVIASALVLNFLISSFVLFKVASPTGSMENTIKIGDPVYTFRLAYLFSDPKRGDIVVFPNPDDDTETLIKRIIGLPGETIEGIDGVVYIDGEPLTEDYLKEPMEGSFGPYDIPVGCYFMMGDNRNISLDARYWDNKFVKGDSIISKAFCKFHGFRWFNKVKYIKK